MKQRIIDLQALWNLPPRPGPADGRPTSNSKWVKAMHQFADQVATDIDGKRYHRPASKHFTTTCPAEFRVITIVQEHIRNNEQLTLMNETGISPPTKKKTAATC